MEVLHARCAGLDVHSRCVNACARIAAGRKVTTEHREFATTTAGLLALAAWLTEAGCTHVAMEATGVYWKPVWHILEDEASFTLVLANAQHIVPGRKSDRNDAAWIADLLAHGLIRGSFVPPAPIQELRDLTRTRKQLVREITRHTQRLQKTLEDANVKLTRVVTDILGVSGRAILAALIAGETDPERLADCTNVRVKASRADIGPGRVGGDPEERELSAGAVSTAHLQAQFRRLKGRRGPKKAIVAVAASMLTAAYFMLRDEKDYHDLGGRYLANRDKHRVTQHLLRRLQDLGVEVEVKTA